MFFFLCSLSILNPQRPGVILRTPKHPCVIQVESNPSIGRVQSLIPWGCRNFCTNHHDIFADPVVVYVARVEGTGYPI